MATNSTMAVSTSDMNDNNFPQTTLDISDSKETNATTTFSSDAMGVSAAPIARSSLSRALYDTSSTNYDQNSLKDFFAKPVILKTGVFSVTDTIATQLWEANVPGEIINNTPLYADKLRGFAGFRGTAHFRIVVNASRFQMGRYFINFVHTAGTDTATNPGRLVVNAHNATLSSRTQLPKVEIDVACDTQATITIPYVSVMNYVPTSGITNGTGFGSVGDIRLYPYSPLQAVSGPTTCSYTIWVHFEDCEFIGPATPQSGRGSIKSSKKGKNATEAEQDNANIGPVTSTLIKVSNAINVFGDVPLLSAYTAPASWIIDKFSKATNIFGWSAPLNLAPTHRMVRDTLPFIAQIDAASAAKPMHVVSKNQVSVMPGFSGTDIDEMDFSFLKTIPAFDLNLNWTSTLPAGSSLCEYIVRVLAAPHYRSIGGRTVIDYKPFEFIAEHFTYWRGSITYTFKFVKTEFHSGRVVVAFFPFDEADVATNTSLASSNYTHREIVDIRECNEVTFNVPYLSTAPWRGVRDPYSGIGRLCMFVLDELRAPNTVPQNCQILVEISGGKDLEFAVPKPVILTPVYGLTPQSGESSKAWKGNTSGMSTAKNECAIAEGEIGSSRVVSDPTINTESCIGEDISSFRSLLKRADFMKAIDINNSIITATLSRFNMLPFAAPAMDYSTNTYVDPSFTADLYGRLSACYAMARGGVRMHLIPANPSNTTRYPVISNLVVDEVGDNAVLGTTFAAPSTADAIGETSTNGLFGSILSAHNTTNNHSYEYQVAQYGRYHSRSTAETLVNTIGDIVYGSRNFRSLTPKLAVTSWFTYQTGNQSMFVSRSMADDGNFGTFKSIPPMTDHRGVAQAWNASA